MIGEPLTDSVTLVKPDYNSLITDDKDSSVRKSRF